jgi:hypothetical protein
MSGKKGHRSVGCRAADILWMETVEERAARSRWRQERVDEEHLMDQLHAIRKRARRCASCGRHYGCTCGPEPITWLEEGES